MQGWIRGRMWEGGFGVGVGVQIAGVVSGRTREASTATHHHHHHPRPLLPCGRVRARRAAGPGMSGHAATINMQPCRRSGCSTHRASVRICPLLGCLVPHDGCTHEAAAHVHALPWGILLLPAPAPGWE